MYKRIHSNLVHFAPPPIRQGLRQTRSLRSLKQCLQPASYAHKMDKITYQMLIIHGGALFYYIDMSHKNAVLKYNPLLHENCLLVCSYIFIANNVESRRCT